MSKKKKLSETKKNLKMSWRFIKKKKLKLVLISILSLLLSLISVTVPILTAQLLLKLSGGLLLELVKIAGFILIIEITRNMVHLCMRYVYDNYMVETITEIQMEMFKETLRIKAEDIDKNTSGTFIDRINNDTNDIVNIFENLISSFLEFISNLGVLMAVIFISYPMFFFFIISAIIDTYVSHLRREKVFSQNKKYRKVRERKTGLISEVVRGVKDIKLLNAEEGILKKTKEQLNKTNKELLTINQTTRRFYFLSGNIKDLTYFLFIATGALLIQKDMLTVANFIILYTYRGRMESLLSYYNQIADIIKNFNLSASRVAEILDTGYKKERANGTILKSVHGNIEFKNVSFSYEDNEVLKEVSFKINEGERVGFVGASGSGKSTIFNLITGLYEVKEGNILIDGFDINNIDLNSLRKNLSLIPQNPYIFNFSIKDNLILSNNNASLEEIETACKKAQIYDRIMEFEDKFETEVGEGGVTLSGGEKQRLAIARTLIKNSNIILFDEATSALDNITQDKVQQAIYGLDKNKTILIIAHRLSTIINCDKIIVVDCGKIVDIGSHKELLERCKIYQKLYKYDKSK